MSVFLQTLRQLVSPGGIEGYFATMYAKCAKNSEVMRNGYRRLAAKAASAIQSGKVLEVGPGPGYVSIEMAKLLPEVKIAGLDLSETMIEIARRNADEHGVSERLKFRQGDASETPFEESSFDLSYLAGHFTTGTSRRACSKRSMNAQREGLDGMLTWRKGNAKAMPFDDGEFDFVVSSGSLHRWEGPLQVFDEIARVLKDDGQCIIRDSKRLQRWAPRLFAWAIGMTIPPDFRVHYWNSIKSSYTPDELQALLGRSRLTGSRVEEDFMDLMVVRGRRDA